MKGINVQEEIDFNLEYLNNIVNELKLSQREYECSYYFAKGKSIREIGKLLKLSPRTVESYLDNVKLKLNCPSKAQLQTVLSTTKLFQL